MVAGSTWDELEGPVLRWVHERGDEGTGEMGFHDHGESKVPGVPLSKLDVALRRLEKYKLITGKRIEATYVEWRWARATPNGLRILGEWPPPPSSSLNDVLARVISKLADEQLQGEGARAARRTAGSIGGVGTVMGDAAKGELRRLGDEAIS